MDNFHPEGTWDGQHADVPFELPSDFEIDPSPDEMTSMDFMLVIFFLRKKGGCVGRISPHPVHTRRHPVDRQGRDVNIDRINKVCPVKTESCSIQAEWGCQQAKSIC